MNKVILVGCLAAVSQAVGYLNWFGAGLEFDLKMCSTDVVSPWLCNDFPI